MNIQKEQQPQKLLRLLNADFGTNGKIISVAYSGTDAEEKKAKQKINQFVSRVQKVFP